MDEEYDEKYDAERAIVFIDGNNLYHCLKEKEWRTRIDIGLLAKRLVGNRTLVHIYYYNAPPPGNKPHTERGNAYLSRVKKTPNLTFRSSWLQSTKKSDEYGEYQSYQEKGCDTAITADVVYLAAKNEYDVAIIVASDGDYAPAAKTVASLDKPVELVYFPGRKPFVMESLAVMRAFRPGYAVPYDSEPPPQMPYKRTHKKSPKKEAVESMGKMIIAKMTIKKMIIRRLILLYLLQSKSD
ncbi:hypothetical protein ES708_32527 [subsurface metagenome]